MLLFSCIIIIHANNFIIIIYVTVVSPLQRSLVQEASVTQGHALQVAEARKIATHDQNCRSEGIVFVPLAVETLGGWSSLAIDTIKAFKTRHRYEFLLAQTPLSASFHHSLEV